MDLPLPPVTCEERLGQVRLGHLESWKIKERQKFTGTSEQRVAMKKESLRGVSVDPNPEKE